ncbi:peptidyl-Lys metalloendopeptidase [Ceratobasidium sp. AG-Ba]|nr:peptidyl-Lys metalloendopeptidase [Ceratobasidium sp. AG-Ba]
MRSSTLLAALFSASLSVAVPSAHDDARSPRAHHTVAKRTDIHNLVIQLQAQDDMNDPDDMTVAATIINKGQKAVKILNDPNGPLSTWKTHTFNIVPVPVKGPNGALAKGSSLPADVDALRVKYNPLTAATFGDDSAFTVLQPGENKTVVHDLAGMYNFHAPGAYTVKLTGIAQYLTVIEDDSSLSTVPVQLYTGEDAEKLAALNVLGGARLKSLKGLMSTGIPSLDAMTARYGNKMIRRAGDSKFTNCSAEQQKNITEALPFADQYIENANAYLNGTLGERMTTWFGAKADNRTEIVKGHYANLTGMPDKFEFDCSCTDANTYAFVYPNKFPTIHLCGAFWRAPANGTDSKAGTIVHEGTHFTNIGGTDDFAYGQSGAQDLAKSDPDKAVMNADSHEYFVENNPHLD